MRIAPKRAALVAALLAGLGGAGGAAAQTGGQDTAPVVDPTQTAPAEAALTVGDAAAEAGELSAADIAFVQNALASGLAEVAAATLAQTRAGSPDVRGFAEAMLRDHPPINAALADIARASYIPAPEQPDALHQAMLAELGALEGPAFDQMYLTGQVTDHGIAVELFAATAEGAGNPVVAAFAEQVVPTLQHHFEAVQQLAAGTAPP